MSARLPPAQRKQLDALSVQLESLHTMRCEYPKNSVAHIETLGGSDELEALDYFYESGWRVIRGKLACPDCATRKSK